MQPSEVLNQKKVGRDTNRRHFNGFWEWTLQLKYHVWLHLLMFSLLWALFSFQMNLSMSFVHLCLWSWLRNISEKKDAHAISVAARSNAWVCGRFLAGTAGSNATGDMDVCLLWVLCVVKSRSLRHADPSSGGVLPSVSPNVIKCNSNFRHPQWEDRR